MKKSLTATLALLTVLSLTAVAHADVIAATPGDIAASLVMELLSWVLVGAVAGVTIFLLVKFWKKTK